jgi:hypothetical protein
MKKNGDSNRKFANMCHILLVFCPVLGYAAAWIFTLRRGTRQEVRSAMIEFDVPNRSLVGPGGSLLVLSDDEVTIKLAMLIEGECGELGPTQAAAKFGFSRQRYFQLRSAFYEQGAFGLISAKRGPKTNYRRTNELVCQAIRHRFLDPEASSEVIAQKLRQCGFKISKRSVDRIFAEFGLQKKTLQM